MPLCFQPHATQPLSRLRRARLAPRLRGTHPRRPGHGERKVCTDLSTTVGDDDFVKVGGRRVQAEKMLHVLLHKPRGYLCTASDTLERRTIFELFPKNWPRVFHVGRLDKESEGLLIVTNDGDLSLKLTHPALQDRKGIRGAARPALRHAHTPKLVKGLLYRGGRAKAEFVRRLAPKVREGDFAAGIETADPAHVPLTWLRGETALPNPNRPAQTGGIASGRMADADSFGDRGPEKSEARSAGESGKRNGGAPRREA